MNTKGFQHWLDDIFLPAVQNVDGQVALILDNVETNQVRYKDNDKVRLLFIPKNVTSRHQPLDMGIINSWK